MKKYLFSLTFIFSLFFSVNVYAYNIDILKAEGIVVGDEGGYREEDTVTRGEFIKMINRTFSVPSDLSYEALPDVSDTAWYFNDILSAVNYGYVKGDEKGNINPESNITRQEAISIAARLTGYKDTLITSYTDDGYIASWAKGPASTLLDLGFIPESDMFRPEDLMTRKECFDLFYNIFKNRFSSGDGSKLSPYVITYPWQLANIRLFPDKAFTINSDLDFKLYNLPYIPVDKFSGTLSGNGHKIIRLFSTVTANNAIFEVAQKGAVISGITLVCPDDFFSVANENYGVISDCLNTSYSKGKNIAKFSTFKGGIADINNGIIENCGNSSYISLRTGDTAAGGICGLNNGTVKNCFNLANGLNSNCFAIAGSNKGTLTSCYSTTSLELSDSALENCYYTGTKVLKNSKFISKDSLSSVFPHFVSMENVLVPENLVYSGNENFSEFSGGNGTASNPFKIATQENFENIKNYPKSYFVQIGDVTFTKPVKIEEFDGYYLGNGYKLSHTNLLSADLNTAIFETNRGTLEGIRIYDGYFFSYGNTASLCLENNGTVLNCSSYSSITGNNCGGLVFINNGEITNSFFEGKISGSFAGGLVFTNNGTISNSYADAEISGKNASSLVYDNKKDISFCIATGSLNTPEHSSVAFINSGKISRCVYNSDEKDCLVETGTSDALYRDNLTSVPFFDDNVWKVGKRTSVLKDNPSFLQNARENTYSFAGGDGTASNPYVIITPIHLNNIKYFPFASFILKNDIDMSLTSFKALKEFNGIFDGNSKKISGLSDTFAALNNGIIANLEIKNSKSSASSFTEINSGSIIACKNSSDIQGEKVSAFAALNNGSIIKCLNNGTLCGNTVASIALENNGSITDCINTANLVGTGENSVIFGIASNGKITRGYNTGDMYFEDFIGTIHPVSDKEYKDTFYLNRYESSAKGGLNYEEFRSAGLDSRIYTSLKRGYPVFDDVDFSDIEFPTGYQSGNGSEENPFLISSMKELYDIRMYPESFFKLSRDLDLSAYYGVSSIYNNAHLGFTPITDFKGELDGNNSTIYALNILYANQQDAGFIINNIGNIKNLTVAESRIEGFKKAGAIAVKNNGKISNITLRGSKVGVKDGMCGAIVCLNDERGQVLNCLNKSDIFASNMAGGIAAQNYNYIANCTNNGGIIANSGESNAISGGIAASSHSIIEKCVNNGKIFSYSDKRTAIAGGITGSEYSEIKNCYNTGALTVKSPDDSYSGGIAGYCSDAIITSCYNIGYITATSNLQYLGSIVGGGLSGKISSCYFDHTLPDATGELCIKASGIFPVSLEDLSNLDTLTGLNKKHWELINNGYYFPQLKTNPHTALYGTENIRDFAGGNGTIENPYKIITKEHLNNVRNFLGSSFTLLSDINMEGEFFSPIGDEIFSFFGVFMGNGHTISNLNTTSGLFRENHGEIYNLKLENINLTDDTAGGIASINTGLIYRCSNTGQSFISSRTAVLGGISGINKHSGMIVSSYTNGYLSFSSHSAVAGGISGYNYGLIAGSCNGLEITSSITTTAMLGGICGYNSGTLSDCINYSNISVINSLSAESNVGGITSGNNGNLVNCISSADTLTGKTTGAICATKISDSIYNCYYLNSVAEPFSLEGAVGGSNIQLGTPSFYKGFDTDTMWYFAEGYFPVLIETMF